MFLMTPCMTPVNRQPSPSYMVIMTDSSKDMTKDKCLILEVVQSPVAEKILDEFTLTFMNVGVEQNLGKRAGRSQPALLVEELKSRQILCASGHCIYVGWVVLDRCRMRLQRNPSLQEGQVALISKVAT